MVLSVLGLSILAFVATGYSQQLYHLEQGKMVSPLYTMNPGNYSETVVKEKPPVVEFKASGMIDVIWEINKNVNDQAPSAWTGQGNLFGISPQFAPRNATQDAATTLLGTPGVVITPPKGIIGAGPLAGVPYGAAFNKKQNFWATRARLKFDAAMGKQVSGTLFFEIDSARWGERNGLGAQRNQAGNWNADSAAVEVKNAYITFAVPPIIPVPIVVNAGILPMVTRPVVNYTDGAGVNMIIRPDPVTIKLAFMKPLENQDWASDDGDVYQVDVKANLGPMTVGAFGAYYNLNTYPFQSGGSLSQLTGAISTTTGGNLAYVSNYNVTNTANFGWYGLYADGKLGPVQLSFDGVYDSGKVDPHGSAVTNPNNKKVTYTGWLARLGLDLPVEKFNIGIVGMYASGADMKKTSASGLPGSTVANTSAGAVTSTKVGSYIVPPNAEQGYDDESIVFYGQGPNGLGRPGTGYQNAGTGGGTVGRGAYGGTWFAKLYANFKPTPWYRMTLSGLYIGDTTKNGNTIGNAVDSNGYPKDSSTIGWEVDLFNDIQIYKNLQLRIGGGYLFSGSAMDYRDQRTSTSSTTNIGAQNPWSIISKLLYVF